MMIAIEPRHRQAAADALMRFRNGAISFDELETEWPQSSADPALKAISARLWKVFYSDLNARTVTRTPLTTEEGRLLDRCIGFLATELPYRWSFESSSLTDRFKRAWSNIQESTLDDSSRTDRDERDGELNAWPFFRSSELDTDAT